MNGKRNQTLAKFMIVWMALTLGVGLAGFPQTAHMASSSETNVVFQDAALEAGLKEILQKSGETSLTAADLQSLAVVDLPGRGIRDLGGLEYATNLTHLNLSDNEISDLAPLLPLTEIRGLNLTRNRIASLDALSAMKDMGQLEVAQNEIASLDVIRGFSRLHTLDVSYNKLANIDALAGASNLTTLSISGNQLTRLDPVGRLAKLESLRAAENRIEDLAPLRSLKGLMHLAIDGNRVTDLGPLRDLTGMRSLTADRNRIKDLTPLRNLTQLYMIYVNKNEVYSLEPLKGHAKLSYLHVSQNRIWNLEPIQDIRFDFSFDTGAARYGLDVTYNYLDTRAGTKTAKLIQKLNPDYLPATQKLTQRLVLGKTVAYVGDKTYTLPTAPFTMGDRTFMPIRFVSEQLGATVNWNAAKKQVTIIKGGKTIQWTAGEKKALVNGKAVAYDVPMTLRNGSTFLPIRFVSEQLQSSVEYEPAQKMVIIFDEA
ncbi:stalk domain-containing protein [Cohnella nanjingensis]|uniref:Copper amine oxidase n=1 Tax=Cohnella nanjingensis TaxID=1387779 RepID=A0A7X0VG83_9BACL|nr:stalk domain-containing protein [Cohnella nanjingensis]MBB6672053.1 copper amine oxidase [Cohnella nanjingensis]